MCEVSQSLVVRARRNAKKGRQSMKQDRWKNQHSVGASVEQVRIRAISGGSADVQASQLCAFSSSFTRFQQLWPTSWQEAATRLSAFSSQSVTSWSISKWFYGQPRSTAANTMATDCPSLHSFSAVIPATATFCTLIRAYTLHGYCTMRKRRRMVCSCDELQLTVSLSWTTILKHRTLGLAAEHDVITN